VTLSSHNQHYLTFLKDIYEVSNACATVTYIWGGFTIDILEGRFLRKHHDLEKAIAVRGMDPEKFLRRVWSFNLYWAKRGYPAYAMPTVARPLLPPDSNEA